MTVTVAGDSGHCCCVRMTNSAIINFLWVWVCVLFVCLVVIFVAVVVVVAAAVAVVVVYIFCCRCFCCIFVSVCGFCGCCCLVGCLVVFCCLFFPLFCSVLYYILLCMYIQHPRKYSFAIQNSLTVFLLLFFSG